MNEILKEALLFGVGAWVTSSLIVGVLGAALISLDATGKIDCDRYNLFQVLWPVKPVVCLLTTNVIEP